MIDKFILNINSTELAKEKTKEMDWELIENNDFKKILSEKIEKPVNEEAVIRKSLENGNLDNKEPINYNEIKKIEDYSFEESVEAVVEVISNEDYFQGNNLHTEKIEEIVAILNQIVILPEFKNLLPVKLEDPMRMGNIDSSLNNISVEITSSSQTNKEALSLVNNILESLNSKNIDTILSSDETQGFKNALEILSENIFKQDTDSIIKTNVMPEIVGVKEVKATNMNAEVNVIPGLINEETAGVKEVKATNMNAEVNVIPGLLKEEIAGSKEVKATNVNAEVNVIPGLAKEEIAGIKEVKATNMNAEVSVIPGLAKEEIAGIKEVKATNMNAEVSVTHELVKEETAGLKEVKATNMNAEVNVIPELVKEEIAGLKEVKATKINSRPEISNGKVIDEAAVSDIKSILTEIKPSLSSERITEIKPVEINTGTPNYGLTSEATEEDKVLAKILDESESGSLNRHNTLFNRLNIKSSDVIKQPMVVSKETMNSDIIKNVKFMMRNAVSELKVKIYPKELGEMTIRLLSEDGILKADINAVSKETYNLLNSNMNEIKKSLELQNIKIYEVNIGLYSDDTTYYSGENSRDEVFERNQGKQGKNSSRESGFLSDDLEDENKLYDDSSVNLLA